MLTQLSHDRRYVVLVLVLVLLPFTTLSARAQEGSRYFPETGFVVEGPMLGAFDGYGGVPVIGLPISAAMETMCEQMACLVQWFERSRIEIHHTDGKTYRGRIGADYLTQRGTAWAPGDGSNPGGCQVFVETGHAACGAFLDGWRRYGGLDRIGLPLTPPQTETYVDGGTGQTVTFTTQWYERAALEDHGSQGVMLRLLGSQTYPNWAERLLAELINTERAKAGLPRLTWHDGLAQVARMHSQDLATHNQRGHIGTDGRRGIDRTTSLGLSGFFGGEAIGYQLSPVATMQALLQSQEHTDIALAPDLTHFGIGYGVVLGPVRDNQRASTVWTIDFWVMQ